MTFIIKILGLIGRVESRQDLESTRFKSTYLKSYDPEANDGRGDLEATHDIAQAKRFADQTTAFDFYRQQPKARPWRDDGEANRPACAFTISIVPAPEPT